MPPYEGEPAAIALALGELAERIRHLHGLDGDTPDTLREPNAANASPAALIAMARGIVASRKHRRMLFGNVPFADPAWDIMLDVAICELQGRSVAVSSVCVAANVPNSTALRWVGDLVNIGILLRWADPDDGRRSFVGLTDQARRAMHAYLSARVADRVVAG